MNEKSNIEMFNEITVITLNNLYVSFPKPISLDLSYYKGIEIDFIVNTLEWLKEEEFIRLNIGKDGMASNMIFTMKGILFMGKHSSSDNIIEKLDMNLFCFFKLL